MKQMSRTAPEPIPQPGSLAALLARMHELRERRHQDVAEIIVLEANGTLAQESESPKSKERDEALKLLNGSAAPFLEMLSTNEPGEKLQRLRRDVILIDTALVLAGRAAERLRLQEGMERLEARKDDLKAVMREVALAVIHLDHALGARDALLNEIRMGTPLAAEGWSLGGRLRNTASQSYRFLETAARENWITEAEFTREIKNAQK